MAAEAWTMKVSPGDLYTPHNHHQLHEQYGSVATLPSHFIHVPRPVPTPEFAEIVRKDLKLDRSKVPNSALSSLWLQIDLDGNGTVSVNEFAGLMRRFSKFGIASLEMQDSKIDAQDSAAHAAKMMEIADKIEVN